MTIYTYSEARQKFSTVLKKAQLEGKVLIKRRDGSMFELQPIKTGKSPLDVEGINVNITRKEVIDLIREIRHRK